jgi:sterol desaturase/sphingolipid hydroxylase (fatty acid hydroxylase superfamily)
VVDDTLFYWAHRGLHESKWLYRNVHKKHHEFHFSIGLGTEYAHPLEDLLSNVLPPFAGPFLLGSHITVCICFFAIKLWQSIDAHSGFRMPFPMTPWNILPGMDCVGAHDFHHSHNTGNYGGFFMFWDWLCGTDLTYKKYLNNLRKAAD